ncbi:MAG TPA: metallophosphoesterase, partial [Polyangiaceae bacterium]|nr:metallophosphoesterase [Polyangiaceae bacterium]
MVHRGLRRGLFLLVSIGLALAVDAVFIEPARLVINRQELGLPNWPAELSGLRVALLSDLHVGSPHWNLARLRELTQKVNAEQPDLILIGGDYQVNGVWFGTHIEAEPIARELGQLRAPLGVFSVLGNHDWWNDNRKVRLALERHGITVLDDQVRQISFRAGNLCLLGVRDEIVRTRSARQELELALPG